MKAITSLLRRRKASHRRSAHAITQPATNGGQQEVASSRKTSNGVPKGKGRSCGFQDAVSNGWFSNENGELAPGFKIDVHDTVIDVGCGDGGAIAFAAAQGAEVIAADIVPATVAAIEQKLSASKARAFRAIVTDCNPLPIPDGTASRVIAMEVLEHVEDPSRFLSELVRVGRPGARYLLTVPGEVSENMQKGLASPSYWKRPNHIRVFSREAFGKLVEDSGLTVESRYDKSFYWAMWWVLYWAGEQVYGEPEGPVLQCWSELWHRLMQAPNGEQVRQKLDEFMPKSQVIVARKAA